MSTVKDQKLDPEPTVIVEKPEDDDEAYRRYVLDNIRQGREDGRAGRVTSHEEVKRRFLRR